MKAFVFILIIFVFNSFSIFCSDSTGDSLKKGLHITSRKNAEDLKKTRSLKSLDEYKNSKRWAIVIGVNNYEDKFIAPLSKAQNDAKGLSDILKNEGQFDYVFTFSDDADRKSEYFPTLNNIAAKMDFLKGEIKSDDVLFFSFSGHGISDVNGKSYLLLADTLISQPYRTSLPLYEIQDWIRELKVTKNIVILDACRNVVEKTKSINTKTIMAEKNSQAEISAVVYATSPGEFSYEHDKEPYGVFTTFMIEALKGRADKDGDTMVTFNELRDHVEKGVRNWAIERNKIQKPYTSIQGEFTGDLALSVIPLKERAKYDPYSFRNNFRKQTILYQSLQYSSLGVVLTGTVATAIGMSIFGGGYYNYSITTDPKAQSLRNDYYNMMNTGLLTGIVFGSVSLAFLIPFSVSFALKPKSSDKKITFSGDIQSNGVGISIKMSF